MSADNVTAWVAIGGAHPLGDLTLYGLFESEDEAAAWADEHLGPVGDWWIAPVWADGAGARAISVDPATRNPS